MADRYWVGGTANWDSTAGTKWAATSGGAGGQSVPTSADAVFFTNLSTGVCTITGVDANAASLNCTGFTGTLALGSGSGFSLNVVGSVTIAAGMTWSVASSLNLTGTGTLTTAGKTLDQMTITGSVTLGDALTVASNKTISLNGGSLNTSASNFSITAGRLAIGTAVAKTLTLNGSTVTLTDTGGSVFDYTGSNLTFNAGTSTINLSGTFGNVNGGSLGLTFNNLSFTSTASTSFSRAILGPNTFANLTLTAPASAGLTNYVFSSGQTITTLVASGASAVRRILMGSNGTTARTLTVTTWSTISDIDFFYITMNSSRSGTRLGNWGGNTNITFPAAKTVYWNLAGAQSWSATGWATTAGGTPAVANFPLAQDVATFTNTGSVTGTITADGGFYVGTVDMSTRTTAMTLSISDINVLGNWTNGSGTALTGTGNLRFLAISGTQTITSAGKSFAANIETGVYGAAISLSGALTTTGTFTCSRGLTLNDNTLTVGNFISSVSNARTFAFGTGNITVTGSGGSAFNLSTTGLTNTGTPVVNMTYSGGVATSIATAGLSEANSISFNITAGTYTLTFSNSGTARNLNFTGFSGTLDIGDSLSVFGNLTLSSGMTIPDSKPISLQATSGTKTVTSNGKAIGTDLFVSGAGGTFQLTDALTVTGLLKGLTLVNGTLDLNGQTATVPSFLTQAGTKNLTFNGGTLVVTYTGSGAFNNAAPTGFTTTAGTGTGTIRMTAASAKTFVGGGSTYNCTLDQGGAGALTITGSNTFSNITNSYGATGATSILFTAGTTTTFANWNASGTAAKLLTIGSVTAASHTLSKASGIVDANFLSVSRSTATGGATWYAGANSTNGGNNTGWLFASPPNGNFFMFF